MAPPSSTSATWRKSSRSNGAGGACVELADMRTHVKVRDSKDPAGAVLTIPTDQWAEFLHAIKTGTHDL
ncbi:DUF397 domain-containing protein [Actinomadura chokoriensis]|uniref:DUF397 domain-containing protein n=1 Tax=Actinomadura chokoriensis TaxID=454156 RepID=UPI0031F932D0